MKRKVINVAIASLLLILILNTSIFATGAQEEAVTSAVPEWSDLSGKTINVLSTQITFANSLKEYIPEFEKLTGIKVNIDILGEDQAIRRTRLELSSKSGAYDVYWVDAPNLPLYTSADWLVPISEMEKTSYTAKEYYNRDDFFESMLAVMSPPGSDELYGIPWFIGTIMMYYRTDILNAAGFDKPPETIDELVEVVKAIHTEEVAGITMRGAQRLNLWHFGTFLHAMADGYFKDFKNGDLTPALNTPEAIEAAEIFGGLLRNYAPEGSASFQHDDVVVAMQQGRAAIAIEGAPLGGQILDPEQSKVRGKVGFNLVPEGKNGRHPAFTGHGWAIPNVKGVEKEAAWAFIQWSTSYEMQKKLTMNTTHIAVTLESLWEDPDFRERWNLPGEGDFLRTFVETIKLGDPDYRPRVREWPQIEDVVGRAINQIITGTITAEKAMKAANEEVAAIMNK